LIIGGSLGLLTGSVLPAGDPSLWAMVGMAAMMGGTMRAPLTATVFAAELTRDFLIIPPLLLGSVAAMGVTVLLMKRSILTEKLARRGQHVTREYAIDYFELLRVGDVMDKNPPQVNAKLTLQELANRIAAGDPELTSRQGTLITSENGALLGIITRGDIVKGLQRSAGTTPLAEIASKPLIVGYADEPLQSALERMLENNVGRLPIVERNATTKIAGYLGRAAILSARMKVYEEERVREPGWLASLQKTRKPAPKLSTAR
jgi:CBS domain-containing protein